MLKMIDDSGFNIGHIWFRHKAHFYLNSVVNRHNWQLWCLKKSHLSHAQLPLSQTSCLDYNLLQRNHWAFFLARNSDDYTVHCAFEAICPHSTSGGWSTRRGVVHARWGSSTLSTRCFCISGQILWWPSCVELFNS